MDLTPELKKQIDEMSTESMLRMWRFAPIGAGMFQGETGKYFAEEMARKRDADPGAWPGISKRVGWE